MKRQNFLIDAAGRNGRLIVYTDEVTGSLLLAGFPTVFDGLSG